MLYKTGMVPRSEYCLHITGYSKTHMGKLVTLAAKAHKKAGTRACPVALIRWRASRDSDPQVRIPSQQATLWNEIWSDFKKDPGPNAAVAEAQTRRAWREIAEEQVAPARAH